MKAVLIAFLAYGLLNPLCLCGSVATAVHHGVAAMAGHFHGHHHHGSGHSQLSHWGEAPGAEENREGEEEPHPHLHADVKALGSVPAETPGPREAGLPPMEWSAECFALRHAPTVGGGSLFDTGLPPPGLCLEPARTGVFLV